MDFYNNLIERTIMNIHTAYIAKIISVKDNKAQVQPLAYSKDTTGKLIEQAPVTAFIPRNIKQARKDITYVTSVRSNGNMGVSADTETITVLVPEELKVGDIVYCGVCERDITNAVKGVLAEPSIRHHNINDSVILKVL